MYPESELTNSKVNKKSNLSPDGDKEKKDRSVVDQEELDRRNISTFDFMEKSLVENRNLFFEIKDKVVHNYKITLNLYIVSFIFGLGLLFFTFLLTFSGTITTVSSIVGGAAGLIELWLVLVFKPIDKIHEIISDYAQISIITSSYQEQVGLRLVQMSVKDSESLSMAANEINLAAKNASEMIQNYCEVKAAPGQGNMLEELMNKIQEFFKKKEKETPDIK